jgi:hypothetical protein
VVAVVIMALLSFGTLHLYHRLSQSGYQSCVRFEHLKGRVNHNTIVLYEGLLIAAQAIGPSRSRSLYGLAYSLTIESPEDCRHLRPPESVFVYKLHLHIG